MKWIILIAFTIFFVSAGFSQSDSTKSVELDPNKFEQKLYEIPTAQLIDVRTPAEFMTGHLKNSINIDYKGDSFEAEINSIEKFKPVFIYCQSGIRSKGAAAKMKKLGFTEIYILLSGMDEWLTSGRTGFLN